MSNKKTKLYGYYVGIGFGIIILVAFLTSQILMPLLFGRAKSVKVPNVIYKQSSEATTILVNKKLHAVVKDSIYSDEIKTGIVVSQKPEQGTMLKPDGTVFLVISKGSKFVKLPDLTGMSVQAAWIRLRGIGLNFTVADSIYSDEYSPNSVIQTSPSAGERVEKNSKIKLIISKGRANVQDTVNVVDDFYF